MKNFQIKFVPYDSHETCFYLPIQADDKIQAEGLATELSLVIGPCTSWIRGDGFTQYEKSPEATYAFHVMEV